jgi:glutathione S-transferase
LKSADWKNVAEFVGIAAIVASLVFVGLQLKQSQEIAIANQYQAWAEASLNLFATHIEADYATPGNRVEITDTLTAGDIAQANWLWTAADNNYYQFQRGFTENEAWLGQMEVAKSIYEICSIRFVWENRKRAMRPEFVALVESWEDPCQEISNR